MWCWSKQTKCYHWLISYEWLKCRVYIISKCIYIVLYPDKTFNQSKLDNLSKRQTFLFLDWSIKTIFAYQNIKLKKSTCLKTGSWSEQSLISSTPPRRRTMALSGTFLLAFSLSHNRCLFCRKSSMGTVSVWSPRVKDELIG